MSTTNFPRGSEWRKWDLHVHTPSSIVQGYGSGNDDEVWEKYLNDLEALPDDFKVLGINDYLFLDGYKRLLGEKSKGRLPNIDLLLPVVEFRLSKFAGVDFKTLKRINLHVIFSNELSPETIEAQFLNALQQSYQLSSGVNPSFWNHVITKDSLIELGAKIKASIPEEQLQHYGSDLIEGFNNLNIPEESIFKILKRNLFKGKCLTAIGKTEWDALTWQDGSISEKKTTMNCSDLVFTAAESPETWGNAKKKLVDNNVNSLLLDCSDAHTFSDSTNKDRIGNCNTWIKADCTFEGLKQITFEPEGRVAVGIGKPEEKGGYQVIESVTLNHSYCKQRIPLNSNLNTIIGGRSTGKSTLLKLIALSIDPAIRLDIGNEYIKEMVGGDFVSVKWQDKEADKKRDIEFFPQSHMYEIARNISKKDKLIEKIVKEKDESAILDGYESFCNTNKLSIQTSVDNLFELQSEQDIFIAQLKEKGDKEGLEKEIEHIEARIKSAHSNDFTTNDLSSYEKAKKTILDKSQELQRIREDKSEIEKLKDEDFFDLSFTYRLNDLSDATAKEIKEIYNKIKEAALTSWKLELSNKEDALNLTALSLQNEIEEVKKTEGFKKGEAHQEVDKQYSELSERLKIERKKLDAIVSIQRKVNLLETQKTDLLTLTVNKHMAYSEQTNKLIEEFALVHEDIEIAVEKVFRKDKCKSLFHDFINLQSNANKDLVEDWTDNYDIDTKQKVEELLFNTLNGSITLKAYKEAKDLTKGLLTENWFSISYKLTYQSDTFEKMSDGKKAFVILKLLLEFSDKKCPILIDQPEDSLDNRAIYNELVTYLKQKKKSRQIILVTHNANIVVNADAEEVIVSNQHGNDSKNHGAIKFQYVSGSIENTMAKDDLIDIVLESQGVREHVCEILEGGTDAFKKRENKYAIG